MKMLRLAFFVRQLSALFLLAYFSSCSWALPGGASIVNGQVTFLTEGNLLSITSTSGSVIDFESFIVGADETVLFLQPSESSTTLIRAIGSSPIAIYGKVASNGGLSFETQVGFFLFGSLQAGGLSLATGDGSTPRAIQRTGASIRVSQDAGLWVDGGPRIGGTVLVSSVPEPESWASMLAGLTLLAARRKR